MSDLALITLLFSCAMLGTLAAAALLAADARDRKRARARKVER